MKLNLTLQRRVAAVEKRNRHRKPLPKIITAIHSAENPGEAIGYEGGGARVMRAPNEGLEALRQRAAREIPSRFIRALYGPSVGILEPVLIATPAPVPAVPQFDRLQPEAWRGWRAFSEGLKP